MTLPPARRADAGASSQLPGTFPGEIPTPRARLQLPKEATLEFITDVEGNWEYFLALVSRSAILSWSSETHEELALADGGFLVFGGDVQDKGPGDIRVTKVLVRLQRRHPCRVFLIAGNRDMNKPRFTAELADGEMPDKDPVAYLDAVSWEGPKQPFAQFVAERGLERGPWAALAWILEKTMGCPTLLQTRRAELELLSGRPVSDGEVHRSFLDSVDPDGTDPWALEYLRAARIMLVVGDCLFVHGALRSRGLLMVPAEDCRDGDPHSQPPPLQLPSSTPIEAWADELNAWQWRQLRLHEAFPRWRRSANGERWRGGAPLMMPSLSGCYVVTDGFLERGNAAPLDKDVAEYLRSQGIRRVFAGHQPQGQCPGVMRTPSAGITVLVADTSFSDATCDRTRNPADTRGIAVSRVTVQRQRTIVEGILADGTEHGYTLNTNWTAEQGPAAFVGCRFSDSSWGQTLVAGQIMTCRGEGFARHLECVGVSHASLRLDPLFVPGSCMHGTKT